jgi:hypothetical protein
VKSAGHVAGMQQVRNTNKSLYGKPEAKGIIEENFCK